MPKPDSDLFAQCIDAVRSMVTHELPRQLGAATRAQIGLLLPKLTTAILDLQDLEAHDRHPSALRVLRVASEDALGLLYYPQGLEGAPVVEDLATVVVFLCVYHPRFQRVALLLTDPALVGDTLEAVLMQQQLLDIRTLLSLRLQLPTTKAGLERRQLWDRVLMRI